MHPDQLTIGIKTVRELVWNQFPQWAGLPIKAVASQGTVNALFRVGDELAARFPLQPADVAETRRWLKAEAEAARELLGRTPFATPEPVAIGEPGAGFPLPWSLQTWLPGTTATDVDLGRSVTFAEDLATWRPINRYPRSHVRSVRKGWRSARPRRMDADLLPAQRETPRCAAAPPNVGRVSRASA
jgi:aminoglycoside phosphotransferase (APT) family kinase protein